MYLAKECDQDAMMRPVAAFGKEVPFTLGEDEGGCGCIKGLSISGGLRSEFMAKT